MLALSRRLSLILLFTGPVILQQATGLFLVRTLPFTIGYFLMAANALPLVVVFAFDPQLMSFADHAC